MLQQRERGRHAGVHALGRRPTPLSEVSTAESKVGIRLAMAPARVADTRAGSGVSARAKLQARHAFDLLQASKGKGI